MKSKSSPVQEFSTSKFPWGFSGLRQIRISPPRWSYVSAFTPPTKRPLAWEAGRPVPGGCWGYPTKMAFPSSHGCTENTLKKQSCTSPSSESQWACVHKFHRMIANKEAVVKGWALLTAIPPGLRAVGKGKNTHLPGKGFDSIFYKPMLPEGLASS